MCVYAMLRFGIDDNNVKQIEVYQIVSLTRQPLGLRATRQPLGGGHKVAPLYFCDDIVATRRDREAKLCTHFP